MKEFECIKIEEMYKKHPKLQKADVQMLQGWLKSQPHLPKITDLEVAIFLHAKYFCVEATKILIDNYYTYRTIMKKAFSNRDITGDDMIAAHGFFNLCVLPKRTPENFQIAIYRLKDDDPSKFDFNGFLKIIGFVTETELLEDGPPEGLQIVLDVTGIKMGHLLKVNVSEVKPHLMCLQEGSRIRIVGFHYLNVNPIIEKLLVITRPFLNNESLKKVYVHETVKSLHEFIPPEILPKDYEGGQEDSFDELSEKYYQKLVERREYFLEEEQTRRVKEELRPTKSCIVEDCFGIDGTFRKLNID